MSRMLKADPQTVALVRLAVERVAAQPEDEQRYLELNFALDRAVERGMRYRELLDLFEVDASRATDGVSWAWRLAAGLGANLMGDTAVAIAWLEQARARLEADGILGTAAASFVFSELARAHYHSGNHLTGIEMANRALQLARSANSLQAEAYAHHYLGLLSLRRRDYDYARRHILAAKDLFQRMHQRQGRARVLDSLASLEMDLGGYQNALHLLQESLQVKTELRDLRGQALAYGSLARLYTALGNYAEAKRCLDRERDLTLRVGDERNAALVRVQLGILHLRHGQPAQARDELAIAISQARERGNTRVEAHACFALAEAEYRLGNPVVARAAMARACDYFAASDDGVMQDRAALRAALLDDHGLNSPEVQAPLDRLRASNILPHLAEALFETATFFQDRAPAPQVTMLYAEALDHAEPTQADHFAAAMRSRAQSAEGRAWVDAMLTVKQQKDRLEDAYAELRKAETLRQSLIQMIVHDLKNPLSAITPWLQTIQSGVLTREEEEEFLQTAIDECGYLLRMIEDLNDVGKLQHEGKMELTLEPLEIGAMLQATVNRLQGRARESGMRLCIEDLPPLPEVKGDTEKLRRALENLVANAIKYGRPPEETQRPPEVWLTAVHEPGSFETGPGFIRIEVRDFGVGIPLAEADRVFEPYYQAETGRKRKAGVGLGLAFCRMVVEAHGGTIWTEPNKPGGSIFAFRLPLAG